MDQQQKTTTSSTNYTSHDLKSEEIERYGRQLITPGIGVSGQVKLVRARVLVVGCGGLGCPVALYLASAGIGTIGLVDYDTVEVGNLHRQIGHNESRIGVPKSDSLAQQLKSINHLVQVEPYNLIFTSETALEIVKKYDVIIDASDNVATRYLINDACVLAGKPLVSGSALKWDGQITVYNYNNGPCYRCLFPTPPPPETVTRCSDGGVLGPIVGVIGSLQALEAIKIITENKEGVLSGKLLIYDGSVCSFRTVRIRGKQSSCTICGTSPSITQLIDYTQFCRSNYSESAGPVADRLEQSRIITVNQYNEILEKQLDHLLIDVRPKIQYEICSLPNSLNIPIEEIHKPESIELIKETVSTRINNTETTTTTISNNNIMDLPIYVVCRRGNKSQDAIKILEEKLNNYTFKHIKDGLQGWNQEIDNSFPIY
eukprot:gene2598-3219_t